MEITNGTDNVKTARRTVSDELSDMIVQIERLEERTGKLAAHMNGEKFIMANLSDDIDTVYDDGLAHLLFCLTSRLGRCASLIGELDESIGNPAHLSPSSPVEVSNRHNRLSPAEVECRYN